MEPVAYSVHAPFDGFVLLAGHDVGVVYAENLCGSGIATGALVDGDEMENAFMGSPVHCEAESDGHCDPRAFDADVAVKRVFDHV